MSTPQKLTQSIVRAELAKVGVTFKHTEGGDFRVRLKSDQDPDSGYFTDSLDDALATGRLIAERDGKRLQPETPHQTIEPITAETPAASLDSIPFDAFEYMPCAIVGKHPDGTDMLEPCEEAAPDVAVWSVYGHRKGYGIDSIGDFKSKAEAIKVTEHLNDLAKHCPVPKDVAITDLNILRGASSPTLGAPRDPTSTVDATISRLEKSLPKKQPDHPGI